MLRLDVGNHEKQQSGRPFKHPFPCRSVDEPWWSWFYVVVDVRG